MCKVSNQYAHFLIDMERQKNKKFKREKELNIKFKCLLERICMFCIILTRKYFSQVRGIMLHVWLLILLTQDLF